MARLSEHGIRLSSMNPTFLNSNSTSHTRPFSAVAELIDNATDPGVSAKQIWIDVVEEGGQLCLTFTDNGSGMTPNKLHKMLSFGFTEKGSSKCIQQAIGIYGNGFKSGSMRLGRDALIFTKNGGCQSVGMLSQTYLENIKAQAVIVPIVPFREQTKSLVITEDSEASLAAILKHSIITSLECIHAHFDSISSKKGTKILIWNIRRAKDGKPEIDFETDVSDFRLPPIQMEELKKSLRCSGFLKAEQSVPAIQYSLREYLSILYLKPRTQIILRGKKVMAKLLSKRLKCIERDVYKPHFNREKVKITFGVSPKGKEHYGIMMYHKNRLIKSYEKVGCQLKASSQKAGVGVIGIIECNFLHPAHNKQDFEYTKEYRLTLGALGQKLNDYWKEVTKSRARERPSQTVAREEGDDEHNEDQATMWLQCEECLKWRSVATKHYKTVPENWTCSQNYNPRYRSCSAPEEAEDNAELSTPTYKKKHKKQDHPKSRKQEEDEEDQEAKQIPSQSSSERSQPNRQAKRSLPHRRTEEEENTSDEDQETTCQQGDDDTNTPEKPLERTAINHKTQDQMPEESETNEHRLVNGERGETEDTETEAMEEVEKNIDISSLKRKLASLINSMGKKPRLQEEQDPDPRKMADEKNPDEQRNTPSTLSSDKTNQDKSSAAEKPGDIAQSITSNPSMTNSLSSTQTVRVSPLSRKEGPCSMEESDPVANVQTLARLEKEAQRLRQLEGLEVTKTTQGTMTTSHCTRDVGCQTSLAESSTSSSSLALNPELQEMMSKKTKAETPSRIRASDSEALEDSRSSQERMRSIRSNMVVLLTALLPQLDLTDISLDTTDIDNILQQIIEVNSLKL